jgi:hypothetical protein
VLPNTLPIHLRSRMIWQTFYILAKESEGVEGERGRDEGGGVSQSMGSIMNCVSLPTVDVSPSPPLPFVSPSPSPCYVRRGSAFALTIGKVSITGQYKHIRGGRGIQ